LPQTLIGGPLVVGIVGALEKGADVIECAKAFPHVGSLVNPSPGVSQVGVTKASKGAYFVVDFGTAAEAFVAGTGVPSRSMVSMTIPSSAAFRARFAS
jgi:hypothetical protein